MQKTKIKTDEKGLEAAAATAVLIVKNTAFIEKEEPIEFVADKPFSFYVYTDINEVKDTAYHYATNYLQRKSGGVVSE